MSNNKPLLGRLFIADFGHGGTDPGAVDPVNTKEGDSLNTNEDDLNIRIGRLWAAGVKALGAEVVYTRASDVFVSLQDRVKEAKKYPDADLFVSFHNNYFTKTSALGFESEVYRMGGLAARVAANSVVEVKKLGSPIHGMGIFERPDLYVLKHTPMPAVLFELGFISNPQEEARLNSPEYQQDLVDALIRAVVNEFGKASTPNKPSAQTFNYQKIQRGKNEIHLVTVKNPKLSVAASPFGTRKTVEQLATGTGAKLALNGGYFYVNPKTHAVAPVTPVIVNGVSVGSKAKKQIAQRAAFCVKQDGSMEIRWAWGADDLKGYKHAIGAGPVIVSYGRSKINTLERWAPDIMTSKTSRTFVGLIDSRTMVFGIVTKAGGGMTLNDLAVFLVERGVKSAMNMDGGGSSTLWPYCTVENRPVTNALLLL